MYFFSKFGVVVVVGLCAANGAMAAEQGFDPNKSCIGILEESNTVNRAMVASWAFGFLSRDPAQVRPVSVANIILLLANLEEICARDAEKTLLQVLIETAGTTTPAEPTAPAAGSEAEAHALLMKFFEPNADRVALTAAILPTEAEVHMVYKDPLASKMHEAYAASLKPGIAFGPKPDHDDLYMIYTTTAQLQNGDAALREFPGGYKKVLDYFKKDVPIVRFKFVKKGETSGMAFDGLVYVNDHWVIMPKPWRALR